MSGNSRVYDPSKLHLKRELTQIRKAARVLRDPGTTSSWKSPLSSSRSVFISNNTPNPHQIHPHHNHFRQNHCDPLNNVVRNDVDDKNNGREREKEKEKRVFLYNWRSNKSSSEKSLARVDLDGGGGCGINNEGSSFPGSVASASVDGSLSDARNAGGGGDSKSDTCVGDHHRRSRSHRHNQRYSAAFRCRDTRLVSMASPTMVKRAFGKKKSRRASSSCVVLKQQLQKQKLKKPERVVLDRSYLNTKCLSQDDSASLIDQSDDNTEEYCVSEDLHRGSGESPLLSRLRHKNRFLQGSRRGDSSYTLSTPALSTSSYNRFLLGNCRNPSTVGSWDGTSASFNDVGGDDEDPLDFQARQGCGIPCYWSKRTPKQKGSCGSCYAYSPSLSDTLRRKGGQLLCGSQKDRDHHRCHHRSLSCSKKQKFMSQLPLLTNSCDGVDSSLGMGNSDDELSTNFGELNLEGLSRLDGRRWSASCRSQDGFGGEGEEEGSSENIRSLSQRYRPIFFDELIGQNIVVHSLGNSISRGRVAPVYLFQGPRGTGKTSTARIFAAALNCLVTEGSKPCGICRECTEFISGKSKDLIEVDGTNKKAIDRVRYLLKSLSIVPSSAFSRYKILLIEECHLLPSKAWLAFLKFLEEPIPRVVFIFVTTDLDNVPHTVLSRCQKYVFNKIKDSDIVRRLRKIAAEENLDVDSDALDLIALNADGSLRDAETMLDQLSLLGKRINTTLVNELVGIIPDEKLLELLEMAMSSNTAETVKRARELMDSGVDPLVLMSQLAGLIMDIIAGSYQLSNSGSSDSSSNGRLSETELEKLKHALKLLSEAEKQLRVSSERSTWFTATLLQLGSVTSPEFTLSASSKKQSSKTTEDDPSTASRDASGNKQTSRDEPRLLTGGGSSESKATHKRSVNSIDSTASHGDLMGGMKRGQGNIDELHDIWMQCIERCHSKTLRQLLHTHGKLLSIGESHGVIIVYIAFEDEDVKSRAERFLISITNSIEMVLRRSVEVRIVLLPNGVATLDSALPVRSPNLSGQINPVGSEGKLIVGSNSSFLLDERSPSILNPANDNRRQEIPMQRIESIIREQRLETAWLQAVERSTPRSMNCLRPEKNQVLPQNQAESINPMDLSSKRWDDELSDEIKALKVSDVKVPQKDLIGKSIDHRPISPSLLHQSGFATNLSKECQGYESGPGNTGCNMLFCWNSRHPRKCKVNQGPPLRSCSGGRFLCFGERRKSRQRRAAR